MMRTVIQGADRAPALPTCRGCGESIAGSATILATGGLVHPEHVTLAARVAGACSTCGTAGFAPSELDDSGRCDECRP